VPVIAAKPRPRFAWRNAWRTTALTGRVVVPDVELRCGALPAASVVALAEDGLGVVCVRNGRGDNAWCALGWVRVRSSNMRLFAP
jgi:hypothetical protein